MGPTGKIQPMRWGRSNVDDSVSVAVVLETLADEHCRTLVRTMDAPHDAAELSERSDIPLSTTYRKLDYLEEATLIEELIEIRSDGRHTSRYEPAFDRIEITLTEDREFELDISRPARTADERLERLWTEVRKGV